MLQSISKNSESYIMESLEAGGWRIHEQNFRGKGFEIDLIASKGSTLAFVEVKARSRALDLRSFEELISRRKRQSIKRGAQYYIQYKLKAKPFKTIRFDLAVLLSQQKMPGNYQIRYFPGIF